MRACMVPFCKNRGRIPGVCYFRLTQNRFYPWLAALQRKADKDVSSNCCICSEHFSPEDILIKLGKAFVRPGAVPTLKLRPLDIRKHFHKHPRNTSTKEMMTSLGISQAKWLGKNQSLSTLCKLQNRECFLSNLGTESKHQEIRQEGLKVLGCGFHDNNDVFPEEIKLEFEDNPLQIEPEELNAIKCTSLEIKKEPLENGTEASGVKSEPFKIEAEELQCYKEHLQYCFLKDHTYSRSVVDWKIKYEKLMNNHKKLRLRLKNCDSKIRRLKIKVENCKQVIKNLKRGQL